MIDYSYNPKLKGLTKIIHHFKIHHYPAKTCVVNQGDRADTLFFMVKGSASVSIKEDDKNMIISYLNTGDFFGELSLFDPDRTKNDAHRTASVYTKVSSDVAEISYANFHQIAHQYPEVLYIIASQMAARLRQTTRKVTGLAFIDTAGRVARTLLDLCKQPDAMTHPDGMQIRVTRQEIGNLAGCSREMVGRVLKEMEDQGLISVSGRNIVVFGTR